MLRLISRMTLGLALLVAVMGVSACSNDTVAPEDNGQITSDAPALPSLTTMQFDLSFFGADDIDVASVQKGSPSDELMAASAGRLNFINAVVRVLFVQLVVYDALEAPIGAFAAAIHSIPQAQEDGSYLWTFIFVEDGIDYGIFLYGKEVGNTVEWRMEVSSTDPNMPLDHFVWFDGVAQQDDSGGYWQFYAPDENVPTVASIGTVAGTPGRESLRIDWDNSPVGNTLMITVNDAQSEDFGNTIEIFESPTMGYLEVNDGEIHNITWFADGTGSIMVPDYNDGNEACWDTEQRDTACE